MSYKLTLQDDTDTMTFNLLEVPIEDPDIEGATDNTTLNGNVWTDFIYLKKQWLQEWSWLDSEAYEQLRGFYVRQWSDKKYPYLTIKDTKGQPEPYTGTVNRTGQVVPYTDGLEIEDIKISGSNLQNHTESVNLYDSSISFSPNNWNGLTCTPLDNGCLRVTGRPSTTWANIQSQHAAPLPAGTYTFSIAAPVWFEVNLRTYIGTNYTDRRITPGSTSVTFTTTSDITTAYLYFGGLVANSYVNEDFCFQVERGSSATEFTKYVGGGNTPNPNYKEQITTITGDVDVSVGNITKTLNFGSLELAKVGEYADKLEKIGGVWKITENIAKVTLNGSEGWTWLTTGTPNNFWQLPNSSLDTEDQFHSGDNDGTPGLVISDSFSAVFANDAALKENTGIGIRNEIMRISVPKTMAANNAAFESLLGTLTPKIYYVLKFPREVTITDQELIEQLDDLASLNLEGNRSGEISIPGTNSTLEITYQYESINYEEKTIVDHKAVRLELEDGGIINNCGVRENISLKMRETSND